MLLLFPTESHYKKTKNTFHIHKTSRIIPEDNITFGTGRLSCVWACLDSRPEATRRTPVGSEASRPHYHVKPPAKHHPQPILRGVEAPDLPPPAHDALASTEPQSAGSSCLRPPFGTADLISSLTVGACDHVGRLGANPLQRLLRVCVSMICQRHRRE